MLWCLFCSGGGFGWIFFSFSFVDVVLGLSFGEVTVPVGWWAECGEPADVVAAQYLWGLDFCSDSGIGGGGGNAGRWERRQESANMCEGNINSERMRAWHERSKSSHDRNWGGRVRFADWINFYCKVFVVYAENEKAYAQNQNLYIVFRGERSQLLEKTHQFTFSKPFFAGPQKCNCNLHLLSLLMFR